ncbi:DUF3866 family protein, partial [Actinomadura sp. 7K534]
PELGGPFGARVAAEAAPLGERHRLVPVPVDGLHETLRTAEKDWGVRLSTMGRRLDEDLPYFLTAAAAGRHTAALLA